MLEVPTSKRFSSRLLVMTVLFGTAVRCQCDEDQSFDPAASFEPAEVIDFGDVAIDRERTLFITTRSTGAGPVCLSPTFEVAELRKAACTPSAPGVLDDPACPWRFRFEPVLLEGLAPSRSATIAVTYRPCPEAWQGDVLLPGFDFTRCSTDPENADLVVVEDGDACRPTREGSRTFTLSGRPVQRPVVSIACPPGDGRSCSDDAAVLLSCSTLNFGEVSVGQPPCDLVVEVKNEWRDRKPVGDLLIERIEVLVMELDRQVLESGEDVGFAVLDDSGAPLTVSSASPFLVPIAPNQTSGTRRFKLRFYGTSRGVWRGDARSAAGLRLYTNDPDHPILTTTVLGVGSAPDLEYYPQALQFGPVRAGTTKTGTIGLSNVGDTDLVISAMGLVSSNPEFQVANQRSSGLPITIAPSERLDVYVRYTPTDSGVDSESLSITTNDLSTPGGRVLIPLTGGAIPRIQIDPSDRLVFANPERPPAPPRHESLEISNIGYSDLRVTGLSIVGPGGDVSHPSVDDFTIAGCSAFPCPRTDVLCAPGPGCARSSVTIDVAYKNTDISSTDLAELHVRSSDPADPEHIVVLSAQDVPCLYPTPIITVKTIHPCGGAPVVVDALASAPGGTTGTVITGYEWRWIRTPGPAPVLYPASGPETTFTPALNSGGVYILGLNVKNDCGAEGQKPATENILVVDQCE